jgi:hypothetical protein
VRVTEPISQIADVCEGDDCGDEHSLVLTKGLFTALGGNLDVGGPPSFSAAS